MNLPGAGLRYFDFDSVMESQRKGSQEDVYVTAALPAVDAFLNGYSACLFVYGQTGSGKSHTSKYQIDCLFMDVHISP